MDRNRILSLLCVAVVCGLLWLGLRPFQRPQNDAMWSGDEKGLRLNGYGTLFSSDSFEISATDKEAESSLEIWVEPGLTIDTSTLLAFSTPEHPLQFSMQQYLSTLILKQRIPGASRHRAAVGVGGVLHEGKAVFLTITSGPTKTSIYVDGLLARTYPDFRLGTDFTGRIVIGTSAVRTDGWLGKLKGLAIYGRELPADAVRKHFESWTTSGTPDVQHQENLKALYLFNEGKGRIVHNMAHAGLDLTIPDRFSLLHQPFLEAFWNEYTPDRAYVRDIAINIVGFVPLGFVFYVYWTRARPIASAMIATLALGFAVSLTIEVLQWYLPTRNSGTTDLFTNTFGAFVGLSMHRIPAVDRLMSRLIQPRLSRRSPGGEGSSKAT